MVASESPEAPLSNAAEVADFNEDFSEARKQHGEDPDLDSHWVGLGITASGLDKLGATLTSCRLDLVVMLSGKAWPRAAPQSGIWERMIRPSGWRRFADVVVSMP